jgi:hypothetical protein
MSRRCTMARITFLSAVLLGILVGMTSNGAQASEPSDLGDELFKLTATDAAAEDRFGSSVALSGNIAIVGAYLDDDAGAGSGSAYLYDASTGIQLRKLVAADGAAGDQFGWSVSVSGTRAIVGAPLNDAGAANTGSAYVFDVGSGNQLRKLVAADAAAGNQFGWSVALSGNTAVVGAYLDNHAGNESGSAYVFDVASGNQIAKLTASDAAAGDRFGWSVAVSGNAVVVGAPSDDDSGNSSGSVYVFDASTGNPLRKLTAADAAAGDQFGWSVGLSGNTAVLGSVLDDDNGTDAGSAYVFDVSSGNQIAKLTASDAAAGDRFGVSVSVSGNTAVVGASLDDTGATDVGSAYVFDVNTGNQLAKLAASDGAAGDWFGSSVCASGNTAVIGSVFDDGTAVNTGSAYVFDATNPVPVELAFFTAQRRGSEAVLEWEVIEAADHAGFHVYREASGSERIRLTDHLLRGHRYYEFVDESPPAGSTDYWLAEISRAAAVTWHGPATLAARVIVPRAVLVPVQPNPFAAACTIVYSLPRARAVRLSVHDAEGRLVRMLVSGTEGPGEHVVVWDGRTDGGSRAAAGLYLVRLEANDEVLIRKAVLTR